MNVLYALRRAKCFHGDRTAILDGDRSLTYREFYERVVRAANALRALGVKRGDRVAALLLNSPEYLELYFACALIGAVIVPINTRWSAADVAFTLRDSESTLLALDDCFASMRSQLDHPCTFLYAGRASCPEGMEDYAAMVAAASPQEPLGPEPDEHDLVGLFYTSGTTGGSKGVMLTHRNLYANALHLVVSAEMSPDWIWLHAGPMFHLADLAGVFALVMVGGGHCFIPSFDAGQFLCAVERYRVTCTLLAPTMINLVVNHPAIDRYDKSSLRYMMYGASPMPLDLLRRAMEKLGCDFMQGYGLTEASPLLTLLLPEDHNLDGAAVRSVGRPSIGVEVRVVDAQDRELPPGQPGEVVGRGANIMKGYWRRPEISADTLRDGWLHTGDIGMFDDQGYLYILDRKKDMIKTGGENVYSPEVESAICAHPDVLEVAVIGVPDEKWGEAIKAVVVRRQGRDLTEPQLIAHCRERMTHFKCPTSVDFVDALPKGGTGKLQKNVLRARYS
jgi:long-chain acyl-CoA synthetase